MLKQKGKSTEKDKATKATATKAQAETPKKEGEPSVPKVTRKAKAGPTMFKKEEPVKEAVVVEQEIAPEVTPTETTVEEIAKESVKEDKTLTIKEEQPAKKVIKKSTLPNHLRPIEERDIVPKDKYRRAPKKIDVTKKASMPSSTSKDSSKTSRPAAKTDQKTFNKATTPEKKKDEKKKKGMESYKRQAFSRVFDSRSALSQDEIWKRKRNRRSKNTVNPADIVRPKEITVKVPISIKELASELKIKGSAVVQKLFLAGFPLTINDIIEDDTTIELIGNECDCKINIDTTLEDKLQITDKSLKEEIAQADPKDLQDRPPVIAVMGHVDHGKTSIIDAFRKSNLTSGEAGAITQHIGAFICHTDHGEFTVLDTPGHEAFTAIRERGASTTDLILLVVAGDEGIKPQTDEAITKAKEANVPMLVAINKMDKPAFNAENIYKQLADRDLLPEAWGGGVITVNCSAQSGEGISSLAEMIALQTEILELGANPNIRARGSVLESEMHKGLGVTATLLVQNGTLNIGDSVVFEHEWGKTKTMHDEHGKTKMSAPPSTPVKVTGLSGAPPAGNEFIVVANEKEAKEIASKRKSVYRQQQLKKAKSKTAQNILQNKVESMNKKTLNIIIKADVGGSLEALKDSLLKLPTDKVLINFVHTGVGQICESDIALSEASGSLVLGFHTKVEPHAEGLIKEKKIKVILNDIIYHMIDDVKEHMQKLLDKIRHEEKRASAKVIAVFKSSRLGNIAGSMVLEGPFKRNYLAKVRRDGEIIFEGSIGSLKRMQDDVKEVKKDMECGILLSGFSDYKTDDIIEGYEITYLEQQLED